MKYLIVDDETSARLIMRKLLMRFVDQITQIDEASSLDQAEKLISENDYDIVFLDIEMPYGGGLDLFRKVNLDEVIVIFTTAYSEYAIQAVKCHAFDYLLKPISPSELKNTLSQAHLLINQGAVGKYSISKDDQNRLSVPTREGIKCLLKTNIKYLIGDRNYTWIHSDDQPKLLSSKTLKEYESMLNEDQFIRIHKSHIISIKHVSSYVNGRGGQVVMSDGLLLPVSRDKKSDLLSLLGQ